MEDYGLRNDIGYEYDSTTTITIASPGAPCSNIFFDWDGTRFTKNFDDYNISTITAVTLLDGENKDLMALMYLVPVVGSYRRSGARPGEITSYRWLGQIRGDHGGFFKNSPFVDIMVNGKTDPISAKVSKHKIQMCGCKSMDMGREISVYISIHINNALEFIRSIKNDILGFLDASEWLLENSKGEQVSIPYQVTSEGFTIVEETLDNVVQWPSEMIVPEQYRYFVTQIMMRCDDVIYHSELEKRIEYYQKLDPSLVTDGAKIHKIGKSMVNYNYHLGFRVDRDILNEIMNSMGIMCNYLNIKNSCVTIEMYSTIDNDDDVIKKKPERWSKQTFRVQLSGNVMHSGPGGDAMKDCYYKFCSIINRIRPSIEIPV